MNTTYWLDAISKNLFKVAGAPALPTKFYLGVCSTSPNKSGSNATEPAGGAYARMEVTGFTAGETGVVSNSAEIRFPKSTANWGTMTNWLLFDADTGGHLLCYDQFRKEDGSAITRTVEEGTVLVIDAGSLKLWVKDDPATSP